MKILLIGSDGTLGTAFRTLIEPSYELVAWTMGDCDLTDCESIGTKLSVVAPDVIINASAYTDVDGAESHERIATLINGDAVGRIASYCASEHATLVHFSTDYVFPGTAGTGYAEYDVPKPVNAYGRSKLHGEMLLRESGCNYLCIRTSRLFGRSSTPKGKKSFIDKMLELAGHTPTISVVNDERTSPTYANDLVQATLGLIRDGARGLYHRTNDGDCTWYEFAQKIFSIVQLPVALVPVQGSAFPRPAERPVCSTLRSTKLPKLRPWQESLKEYLSLSKHTV